MKESKITQDKEASKRELTERNRVVHITGLNQGVLIASDCPEDTLKELLDYALNTYYSLKKLDGGDK